MSIQAVTWALAQDLPISSAKFVLVCLANYADQRGVCYPSQARLCADTGQDRKTVQLNLKRLSDAGLLRDTGHRIGVTKGVIVYKIIGLPESSTRHYVYRTTDPATGEFYVGKRSFDGDPELDTYRGSGRWVLERLAEGVTLVKEVVSLHQTSEEAIAAEYALQRAVDTDPLCMNGGTPSKNKQRGLEQWAGVLESMKDREKRDSLGSPFFPPSEPKNGQKQAQKRATEPSVTINDPSGVAGGSSTAPARTPVAACFRTYADGIRRRYRADFPPSAKANGQLSNLVSRLGAAGALRVVEAYLASDHQFYVNKRHSLAVLLVDAERIWIDLQAQAGGADLSASGKPWWDIPRQVEERARKHGMTWDGPNVEPWAKFAARVREREDGRVAA